MNVQDTWPGNTPAQTTHSFSILTFQLDGQVYGLPITDIAQIIEMVTLTHLPQAPAAIQGIINLHGKIVPVLDLRLRFGLPAQPYQLHTPIILADLKRQILGLIVDSVEEVLEIAGTDLETSDVILPTELIHAVNGTHPTTYLAGVAKVARRLIPLLKTEAILSQAEQSQLLEQIAGSKVTSSRQQVEERV
ncbi:MAG: purine-binding chemotaxis protein CheW [Anaerolineales bacterium]|nr:purine-binding chemotaxis protein CheW [Anaerolineales bacterium]